MTPEHLRPTQAISSTEKRLSNISAVKDLFKIRNLEKKIYVDDSGACEMLGQKDAEVH